jgi:hypothetical protein
MRSLNAMRCYAPRRVPVYDARDGSTYGGGVNGDETLGWMPWISYSRDGIAIDGYAVAMLGVEVWGFDQIRCVMRNDATHRDA